MDTEYLRSGRGDAVVVVAAELGSAEVHAIMACLNDRYLVLAASPPLLHGTHLSTWLDAFLEGLGIHHAHLFVLSSMAHRLVSGDPDHV